MSRTQIVSLIDSGEPFSITMTDGNVFSVPHRDYISIHPKEMYVIVYDDDGKFHILALRNMTTLTANVSDNEAA